jgi:hypothetical protein
MKEAFDSVDSEERIEEKLWHVRPFQVWITPMKKCFKLPTRKTKHPFDTVVIEERNDEIFIFVDRSWNLFNLEQNKSSTQIEERGEYLFPSQWTKVTCYTSTFSHETKSSIEPFHSVDSEERIEERSLLYIKNSDMFALSKLPTRKQIIPSTR